MKKIFVLLAVVFSFSAVLAFGGGDKVINKNQLPAQAQSCSLFLCCSVVPLSTLRRII